MKSKDIAIIIAVAGFSAILAYVLSSTFITSDDDLRTTVKVVEPLSPEFTAVDTRYFNENANNPTKLINIGSNDNNSPFLTETEQ